MSTSVPALSPPAPNFPSLSLILGKGFALSLFMADGEGASSRQGLTIPNVGTKSFLTYESNVAFVMRYMVDAGIVGANWVTLPAGKYLTRSEALLSRPFVSSLRPADEA